jgi:uncharacterized protein YcbK (DUF882 family)
MNDLTVHFSRSEFRSRDGAEHPIDCRLLGMLEQLRQAAGGRPITITSGYRSPEHNRRVGGASNSYHLRGMAADLKIKGMSPRDVYGLAESLWPDHAGLGLYQSAHGGWIHVDCRADMARWEG